MTDKLKSIPKLNERLLFNFLAADADNATEVMEAADGFAVPGIVSTAFDSAETAADCVKALKTVTPVVSIGLGGGGDTSMWHKVIDIALLSDPGHINQPFHTASYASGIFDQAGLPQFVNALIAPTGKKGIIRLAGGQELELSSFLEIASIMQTISIKVMPMKGLEHLEELVYIAEQAAQRGIYGIEPAGGIHAGNIGEMVGALLRTDIPFVMPHVFGNTIDAATGRTIPEKVREVVQSARTAIS